MKLDPSGVLTGEAKWKGKIDIKRLAHRLESTIDNLPFAKGKKIVLAYWVKQCSGKKHSTNIITASDVLGCLK